MAGLMPVWSRAGRAVIVAGLLMPLLAWPATARAGWFVRDNQTAYRLAREGHDRQSLAYWDGSAEGLYGRGTALLHLGRMREAEQAFRQCLTVAPHKTGFADDLRMPEARRPGFMASLWYNLGNTLYAQDRLAEARQAWLKALHLKPGHAKARHNLAIVDRVLGERERRDAQPLAGLPGSRRKQAGKKQSTPAGAASPQQQQRTKQHGLLPLHRSGSSGQAGPSGAPATPKGSGHTGAAAAAGGKHAGHAVAHPQARHQASSGTGAPAAGKGAGKQRVSPDRGKGMSAEQASKELGMVNEGVSVFLRHRLQEKSSQAASGAGDKPW